MAHDLGELWKKGTSSPLASDLVEGGLAVDVAGRKVYSKGNDGGIFEVGGGGFAGEHNDLAGRTAADAHPMDAITGLNNSLAAKENDLDKPTEDGQLLASTAAGTRSWVPVPEGVTDHTLLTNIGTNTHADIDTHLADVANPHGVTVGQIGAEPANANIQTHVTDVTSNPHEVTAAQVGAAPATHQHDDLYFLETEHIVESIDPATSGSKPIITDPNGKINMSFMQFEGLHYVTTFTPVAGDLSTEYPDTTTQAYGDVWIVDIPAGETFTWTVGDLFDKGQTAEPGDFMIWGAGYDGAGEWGLLSSSIDPDLYYKLDGTKAITGAFAGGGHQLKSIGDATDAQDAVALGQVQPLLDNYVEIAGDEMTGNLLFDHFHGIEMTSSLDAKYLVMNIDPTDKLIVNGGGLPVFTKGSWSFNFAPESFVAAAADNELMRKVETEALVSAVDGGLDTHIADVANPHAVTKAQVGLGSVENLTQDEQFFIGAY